MKHGTASLRGRGLLCLVALGAGLSCGCRSTGYLAERRRDLADVATASVGLGIGAKARLGPVHLTPFVIAIDTAGLRGGEWFHIPHLAMSVAQPPQEFGALWWSASLWDLPRGSPDRERLRRRGKAYLAAPPWLSQDAGLYDLMTDTLPFVSLPRLAWKHENVRLPRYPAAYHTQIELILALGGSLRLGLNPGELADFFLGWFGLDIYHDDGDSAPSVGPAARAPAGSD